MADFTKNNLGEASSPYLRQHKTNPIHWQEWTDEVLERAKEEGKLLFVSVGYSTCHWCHVMRKEVFSSEKVAEYLNERFVCIKVDREQRPDVDQYLMGFLVAARGQGGWPLNVVLTPDGKPFFGATYIPLDGRGEIAGFLDVMERVVEGYLKHKEEIVPFSLPVPKVDAITEKNVLFAIEQQFDPVSGGFGAMQKFPPHTTLIFLLHYYEQHKDIEIKNMLLKTLDNIALRGLHDHLQGGFFRYCVDKEWTIPHFEKMLYDQGMLLWVYSLAYQVFKKELYYVVVEKLICCLQETFSCDDKVGEDNGCSGLFYSAHDADTNGVEGETYLWNEEELHDAMSDSEYELFYSLYQVRENVEGKIHLLKKKPQFLPPIEKKLLLARRKKEQPFLDKKIITSWNALVGIGFVMAGRYSHFKEGYELGKKVFFGLFDKHYVSDKGVLCHSSFEGSLQQESFLEDYAGLLLLGTYLYEEGVFSDVDCVEGIKEKLLLLEKEMKKHFFRGESWYDTVDGGLCVPAQLYDHPLPSNKSLALFALQRFNLLLGGVSGKQEVFGKKEEYAPGGHYDFFNLLTYFGNGNLHFLFTKEALAWTVLPLSSVVVSGPGFQDCFLGGCRPYQTKAGLLDALKNKE